MCWTNSAAAALSATAVALIDRRALSATYIRVSRAQIRSQGVSDLCPRKR
jgi:hypothetical protein